MIRVDDGHLAGSVPWRFDPFFRPTLAVFHGERLRQIVATSRRPPGADGSAPSTRAEDEGWPCTVPRNAIPADRSASQTVIILETGEIVFESWPDAVGPEGRSVGALIRDVRRSRKPFSATGFPVFLGLPLVDQLTLLQVSVPGADLNLERQREIEFDILSGKLTILDVRDDLLRKVAAGALSGLSMDEGPGRWLVWEGLQVIAPQILRRLPRPWNTVSGAEDLRLRTYLPSRSMEETASHLARVALGPEVPPELATRWTDEHRDHVRMLVEQIPVAGPAVALRSQRGLVFPNLLSAMTIGPAGRRRGAVTEARPGSTGLVASGPGLWLRPGSYRVRLAVARSTDRNASPSPAESTGSLTVEVVYFDTVLTRQSVVVDGAGPSDIEVDFRVPERDSYMLGSDGFGVRLWSGGRGGFEISRATLEVSDKDVPERQSLEWLPAMRQGAAARTSVRVPSIFNRRWRVVVYGPYTRLLPGRYRLEIDCLVASDLRGLPIRISVTRSGSQIVASSRSRLRGGLHTLTLPFSVPEPLTFESLYRDLEFVLRSPASVSFDVTSVRTVPEGRSEHLVAGTQGTVSSVTT